MNRVTHFPIIPVCFPSCPEGPDFEWSLDQLHSLYDSLGSELDLFTSRDFDSSRHFEMADEIEIGLILFFSALSDGFPMKGGRTTGNWQEDAERLKETAEWLNSVVARLDADFDAEPLSSRLEAMAQICQDLSSAIWWQWLLGIDRRLHPHSPPSACGTETALPPTSSSSLSLN